MDKVLIHYVDNGSLHYDGKDYYFRVNNENTKEGRCYWEYRSWREHFSEGKEKILEGCHH